MALNGDALVQLEEEMESLKAEGQRKVSGWVWRSKDSKRGGVSLSNLLSKLE